MSDGGIMGILIALILIYGLLLGCYYGYKKYKENQLCNETQNNAWFLHTVKKHLTDATVYVESEVAKGIDEEDAVALIINGFCKEVLQALPMEFALEAQKLVAISLEGSVG